MLHVNLGQFLAAVELLGHPELRGLPVVASYEARAFGVSSGLPLRSAARRCPDAVVEVMGWDEARRSSAPSGSAGPPVSTGSRTRRGPTSSAVGRPTSCGGSARRP